LRLRIMNIIVVRASPFYKCSLGAGLFGALRRINIRL